MVTILPKNDSQSYKGLGDFLSTGLSGLAQNKLQAIQRANDKRLAEHYNLNPQQAEALSYASPEVKNDFFKQNQFVARPDLSQNVNQDNIQQLLSNLQGNTPEEKLGNLMQLLSGGINGQSGMGGQQAGIPPLGTPVRKKDAAQEAIRQRHEERLAVEKSKADSEIQDRINAAERPSYKEAAKKYQSAQIGKNLLRDQLTEKRKGLDGALNTAILDAFTKWTGIDTTGIKGTPTQVFDKIGAQLISELSRMTGGRVTNLALQNFMKQVASSKNSPEAIEEIIKHANHLFEMDEIPFQVMQELRKKNKGEIPKNLEFDAAEIAGDRINKLAQDFNNRYSTVETPFGNQIFGGDSDSVESAKKIIESKGAGSIELEDGTKEYFDPHNKKWIKGGV